MSDLEIILDENLGMYINLPGIDKQVWLVLSDELKLASSPNNLPLGYKNKICELVDKSDIWNEKAINYIYKKIGKKIHLNLIGIHLLSEYTDPDFIFGLEFGSPEENEHGIGLKMSLNSMDIIDFGDAEVSLFL